MQRIFLVAFFISVSSSFFAQRTVTNLNKEWKFIQKDDASFKGADFDAAEWQPQDVPHDWAFENGIRKNGAQGQGGGYHDGGVAWYRKNFELSEKSLKNTVYLEFEGVYMNSEVWINGHYLGKRPYGYISFRYDISKYIVEGENTIAVRVDNSLESSARWYHPCGIYAPVHLIEVSPVHILPNGIFITTPEISKTIGLVNVEVKISDFSSDNIQVKSSILSKDGKVLSSKTESLGENSTHNAKLEVASPLLWSPEAPNLYTLVTEVLQDNKVVDEVKIKFGFRTVKWEAATGFWLNNKNVKLKGVCEHWEGGPVAGAWTKPLLRWKLQLLKDMGINAIRPSHNPNPRMFYDLCDEIGLLVMDEIFDGWHKKAPYDYGAQAFDEWWQRDITEWITRDRNHPSVFIWSLGNETHSDIAPILVEFCNNLDATRLVTSGSGNTEDMQVAGINGGSETQSFIENRKFDKPFISTEAPHTWQTRGYYRTQTWWRDGIRKGTYPLPSLTEKEIFFYEWANPKVWKNKKQHLNSSYDNATVRISARKNWEVMRDNTWHSGHFRWTGFDYYGESGLAHGGWPFNLFMGGALDVAGFKKDLYYLYQSQWSNKPILHILPHWTHPRMKKGTQIPVWVYSNADEVELFLNGKSLGKDKPGTQWDEMQCDWLVPFEVGVLEAVAYKDGKEIKRTRFVTANQPVKLKNSVQTLDAESGFNANFILSSEAIDAKGNLYPYAQNKVYYALSGDIEKVSLESGSPVDATSRSKANYRRMFMGKNRAFLQAKENAEVGNVVVASILGDQSLHLSKQVTIVAEQVPLIGTKTTTAYEILYTINGEDPSVSGTLYTKAFEVLEGTTVKAIVKKDDKVMLKMEETFGANQGLFWGDGHSEDMWIGRGITHAAESAVLKGGAKASENGRRFKSDGFVDFNHKEGSITWYKENDGDPGDYNIRIRYTHNDKKSKRPMTLIVNDEVIKTFDFTPSGSWEEKWKFVNAKVTFKAGANHIVLKTNGESGPHIDELFID